MAIREGPWQSKNDHDFIIRALRSGRRADGRQLGDMRLLRMVFARAEGEASAEIQLGRTRVLGVVTGEVVPPFPDRPTDGFLHFNVELGPMAAANFGERHSALSVEIARVIEVGVKESQALDTEALCIIGGEKVWQLRCDVHVLDHGGNLIDACVLATMAALRHFRRPEVTIDGSKVVVHHTDDKEPHPLALHHVPICVTFAIFEDTGDVLVSRPTGGGGTSKSVGGMSGAGMSSSVTQYTAVDPTEAEEEVMKGRITFALTVHKEICALHKNGGVAMTRETILGCARLAAVKVEEIHHVLDDALAGADAKAALDRQNRLRGTKSSEATAGPRPVPGMVQGKIPAALPGTRSTPFVVGQAPMPVAPEALEVKHLEYDDLHVTQGIREEGLRGGGNRGGRGLDMNDARNTDLFAKMAAAASMTEARIAEEEDKNKISKGDETATTTSGPSLPVAPRKSRNGTGSASAAGVGRRKPEVSTPGGGAEMESEESEFARMAQTLRERSENNGSGSGSVGSARTASAAAGVDVDSDEEETVTLEGEFKAAGGGVREANVAAREEGAGAVAAQNEEGGDDDNDDDLLSAVKKGKGRGSEKRKAKGKRGKT
ncbi:unnamed protein product [Pylaiella littoralis]